MIKLIRIKQDRHLYLIDIDEIVGKASIKIICPRTSPISPWRFMRISLKSMLFPTPQ